MARVLLLTLGALTITLGGVAAWRVLQPPPPVADPAKPLDQRPYGETTDKEREDWMRKLGYTD